MILKTNDEKAHYDKYKFDLFSQLEHNIEDINNLQTPIKFIPNNNKVKRNSKNKKEENINDK